MDVVSDGSPAHSVDGPYHDDATRRPSITEELKAEVRWQNTGEVAASVLVRASMSLLELKTDLSNLTGVSVPDQRIFADGEELLGAKLSSGIVSSALTISRVIVDPRKTDLSYFRVPLSFDDLPQGEFAEVRVLAKGINGDIVVCNWTQSSDKSETVAVKKFLSSSLECIKKKSYTSERDIHLNCRKDPPHAEDALTEIGIMTYLAKQQDLPVYLMRARAVFLESSDVWLVTDYAEGGELFDVAASPMPLAEAKVKQYMWQLLQAIEYLHRHRIGHRDVSLENVLLKDGVVRLVDFGLAAQSCSEYGLPLRYFCAVGKDFYRAPECYVPQAAEAWVTPRSQDSAGDVALLTVGHNYLCEVRLPADARPHKACFAEVWGYVATPADVFSAGICLLILGFQNPAWNQAVLEDPGFTFVFRHGQDGLLKLLRLRNKRPMSPEAMQLLSNMMQAEPSRRPTAAKCLSSPWFAELRNSGVLAQVPDS